MRNLLRPPGADEKRFISLCIRCGKCMLACPYRSIRTAGILAGLDMAGTPYILARKSPCYLCMKCPSVCPTGALDRGLDDKRKVRMGAAVIDRDSCLAWQGTICRSCYNDCPLIDEAIKMDEDLRPVVDRERCVGCGICENVCPVEPTAIEIRPGRKA